MSDYACPLRTVEGVIRDDGQLRPPLRIRINDCGATLHLVWHHDWPIDPEDLRPIDGKLMPGLAYTDSWEVVCENGHQLANSIDGNDSAQPFDPVAVMEALGAPIVEPLANELARVADAATRPPSAPRVRRCRREDVHPPHFYDQGDVMYECPGDSEPPAADVFRGRR